MILGVENDFEQKNRDQLFFTVANWKVSTP